MQLQKIVSSRTVLTPYLYFESSTTKCALIQQTTVPVLLLPNKWYKTIMLNYNCAPYH